MASRPIWKGSISFGLVYVPVTLYNLEHNVDLHFKLLDSRNHSAIRYERINETTGEEVPWDKLVKGYEYTKGNFVIIEEEEFKKVAVEATQTIEIVDFIKKEEISDLYFDKPYILVPQKKAEKGYVLLRDVLQKSQRIGIAKVVIRTREYLSAVQPLESGLVLMLLRFAQEILPLSDFALPTQSAETYKISPKEVELATQLVDSQSSKWDPSKYKDEYREQLLKWIEEKAEKGHVESIEQGGNEDAEVATNVVDLVELLRKSVSNQPSTARAKPDKKQKASKASKSA